MISRYKWYEVRLPIETDEFISKLQANAYTPTSNSGFIVDGNNLRFRYIWQSTISTTQLDSEGNPQYQEASTINSQDVAVIVDEQIMFRVESPARSTRELMNSLERIVGFGFSCQPLSLRDQDIHSALIEIDNKNLNSLKVSGPLRGARALARIEIASKEGLNPNDIEILNSGEYVIEAALYDVSFKGVRGQIGFSKAGTCKLSGPLKEHLLSKIENVLLDRLKAK
jgi:hypothetical protein